MNIEHKFYLDFARVISALEKRNMVRRTVKNISNKIKPEISEKILSDYGFSISKEEQKEKTYTEVLRFISKNQVGIENGSETLFQCKMRHDINYKRSLAELKENYPSHISIIQEMLDAYNLEQAKHARKVHEVKNELALAIYRMITIYKFSSNHSDNIQNLSNILNCRYLNLDTIRDTSTKTHFIGEDKFIKSMTSSDETISRAAEYFEKKEENISLHLLLKINFTKILTFSLMDLIYLIKK